MSLEMPASLEAERSVLGAVLVNPTYLEQVHNLLGPEDFYSGAHQRVYAAMLVLAEAQKPIDVTTLYAATQSDALVETAGGAAFISRLMDGIPRIVNVKHYADIVRERARRRSIIKLVGELQAEVLDLDEPVEGILSHGEERLRGIGKGATTARWLKMSDMLPAVLDQLEARCKANGLPTGVPTGFPELDATLDGLQRGDLVLVAARPSMGKTSFAMSLAQNVAAQAKRVAVFSLEMSGSSLAKRLLYAESRIDRERVMRARLSERDWNALITAHDRLLTTSIFMDETVGITVPQMLSRARALRNEGGLDLIVIDYIGLVRGDRKTENRTQEVAAISTALKDMARKLDVPVMALSQLNRGLEARTVRRPQLSDLRDSGRLEEDADVVLMLHREAYYMEQEGKPVPLDLENEAEVIVAKHRNGPTGVVKLHFDRNTTRFLSRQPQQGTTRDAHD